MRKPRSDQAIRSGVRTRRGERGHTLVELLAVLATFLLLSGAILSNVVVSQKVLAAQEELTATQQEARATLLIMSDGLLLAGCGVPARLADPGGTGQNVAVTAATTTSVSFRGCFSDPVARASLTAPSTLNAVPGSVVLAVDSVTGFAANNTVYLSSRYRWAYGTITSVNGGASTVTVNFTAAMAVPVGFAEGSLLYREEIITFDYNAATDVLQRSVQIPPAAATASDLALSVEDLKISYYDASGVKMSSLPLSLANRRAVNKFEIEISAHARRFVPGTSDKIVWLKSAVQPRNLFAN